MGIIVSSFSIVFPFFLSFRKQLFEAMGLELKDMKHKNRTKRKYTRKDILPKLKPVYNDEWKQKETLTQAFS